MSRRAFAVSRAVIVAVVPIVVLLALSGCRNDHPMALMQVGVPYRISIHYLPATVTADAGTTLAVPPALAAWTGTLVVSGSANGHRTGVLAITGTQTTATIREHVTLTPDGDGTVMAVEGTSYELVNLPAGSDYVFQLDDFRFSYDSATAAWICRNHRNVGGVLVDATFTRPPTP